MRLQKRKELVNSTRTTMSMLESEKSLESVSRDLGLCSDHVEN